MNKRDMLDAIKKHLNIKTNKALGDYLGISSQAVSNWYSRNTFDGKLIHKKCSDINPAWLMTGEGNMLMENETKHALINNEQDNDELMYNEPSDIKNVVLERIISFINDCQLSKKVFADAINMEQSTVNNQLIGKRGLSIDLILSFLSSYSNISAEWLLRGRGDMYICNNNEASTNTSYKNDDVKALKEEIIRLKAENGVLREVIGIKNESAKVG